MKVKSWRGWTAEWEKLLEVHEKGAIPSSPGVYMIVADRAINRAVGSDEHGILDVGESEDLKNRISAFVACARGDRESGHIAGWRFSQYNFEKEFPLRSLYVSWFETTDKAEAYKKEGEILLEYYKQHYELPPLNFKFNWSD